MTKTRLFRKDYAAELLLLAQSDLETAGALIKAKIKRKENILFHIQQAIEKALKAQICWLKIPVPLTHDLMELLREIPNFENIPHSSELYDLTQFATIRRYEEGVAIITDDEIQAAFVAANDIVKWVEIALSKP